MKKEKKKFTQILNLCKNIHFFISCFHFAKLKPYIKVLGMFAAEGNKFPQFPLHYTAIRTLSKQELSIS